MADTNDLPRINQLNSERALIAQALRLFDEGGRIQFLSIGLPSGTLIDSASPPPPFTTVPTEYMDFSPAMLDAIKQFLDQRHDQIQQELTSIGMTGIDEPPTPTRSVPRIISRRQFFQASAKRGMITQAEALDAVRHGEIPALMQQGLGTLSPDEKFAAEMLLSGAGEFERRHPLVNKFAEVMHMPPEALDEMWRYAATL